MTDLDPVAFAQAFLGRGIEFVLRGRNRRLYVWPRNAWVHLTEEEHAYIDAHSDELKALAESKVLGETAVVWTPPTAQPDADGAVAADVPDAPAPICKYCGRPCVGEAHELYAALHWRDPAQIARRDREATAVMRRTLGRTSPFLEDN